MLSSSMAFILLRMDTIFCCITLDVFSRMTGVFLTNMKALRKSKGYSQVKMQLLTGIDQSDYSKIETGKRNMTFDQCRRIALVLETSMDYLAGLTDEQQPYPPKK